MGGDHSSSFIPKRNPVRRSRRQVSRQVYLFTILSYASLLATMIAAGGVFFYSKYTDRLLSDEVAALDTEIRSFSESDMDEVLAFDERLKQVSYRFDRSVSIRSLLEAIEAATLVTVQINNFTLTRVAESSYHVEATLESDTFDSTIFQRGVMERDQQIASVAVSGVTTGVSSSEEGNVEAPVVGESTETDSVTFSAALEFAIDDIPLTVEPRTQAAPAATLPTAEELGVSVTDVEEEPIIEPTL